jgi:hypothetical protein
MGRSSANRSWWAGGLACAAALLLLSGCEGGSASRKAGGITGSNAGEEEARAVDAKKKKPKINPEAPIIADPQVRPLDPEKANRNVRYVIVFAFHDGQGDVGNGEAEVVLNDRSLGRVPIRPRGISPDATDGFVGVGIVVRASAPIEVNGIVRIFDRSGNQSNDLAFLLGINQLRQGESGGGAPEVELESATATGRR